MSHPAYLTATFFVRYRLGFVAQMLLIESTDFTIKKYKLYYSLDYHLYKNIIPFFVRYSTVITIH